MLPLIAAVAEHGSKTAFYVAGGALACWAVLIGVIGVTRPAFPRGAGAARGVMAVSGVLMVAAMATAVITS
ncbi:MAG: hypothetical protein JSS99_07925 [Actinobacteria bacterium]|nr:hypothetical protein [Actinomycetota bacterium]